MLREIIKPSSEHYDLHIPKEYIGKDIEVIVLPLFDLDKKHGKSKSKIFNPNEFYGVMTTSRKSIDDYLLDTRKEWE